MLNDTDTQVMKDYIHRNALDLLLMEQTIDKLKMENRHLIGDEDFEYLNKQRMNEDKRDLNNYSSLNKPIPNNTKLTNNNDTNNNNSTSNKTTPRFYYITNKNPTVQQNDAKKCTLTVFFIILLNFVWILITFLAETEVKPKINNKNEASSNLKKNDRNYLDIRNKQLELLKKKVCVNFNSSLFFVYIFICKSVISHIILL